MIEKIIENERTDIYKISDSKEYREAIKKKDFEAIKKLATFHTTKKNVVAKIGRQGICEILAAELNVSGKDNLGESFPNVCALGTSTTAHDENSTQLYVETFRKLISSRNSSTNTLRVLSHYLPEDCEGAFREEGIFIQGVAATANSGKLLSVISLSASEGDKTLIIGLLVERIFSFNI